MSLLTKKRPSRILKSPNNSVTVFYRISNPFYLLPCSGQGMLPSEESFFKNGKVNKDALVDFIKTIKKNTNLSDEDAAIMAASKVFHLIISWPWNLTNLSFFVLQREKSLVDSLTDYQVVDSRPKTRIWYRINATRNMTGGRKIQPTFKMNDKLKEVKVVQ